MDIAQTILTVSLIGIVLSIILKKQNHPSFKAVLLLLINSREKDEFDYPTKSILIKKFVLLPAPPLPGMELDGQGTHVPLHITQTVLTESEISVHLKPIQVPHSEVESYAKNLEDCKWVIFVKD